MHWCNNLFYGYIQRIRKIYIYWDDSQNAIEYQVSKWLLIGFENEVFLKSMDWFLYDYALRHEKVNSKLRNK